MSDELSPCEFCVEELEELRQRCRRLKAENSDLRRRLAASSSISPVMPPCPFETDVDFEEWESQLRGISEDVKQRREQLRVELMRGNFIEAEKYLKYIWRSLLTDEAAENYSYIGNGKDRKAIKGYAFTTIFKSCYQSRFGNDSSFFVKCTKRFFNYAKDNRRRLYNKIHETEALTSTERKMFKCEICSKMYLSDKRLLDHVKLHGPDGTLIHKCPYHCMSYFATKEEAQYHARQTHLTNDKRKQNNAVVCDKCGKTYSSRTLFTDHQRSDCGRIPFYLCEICGTHLTTAGNLKKHLRLHKGDVQLINYNYTIISNEEDTIELDLNLTKTEGN